MAKYVVSEGLKNEIAKVWGNDGSMFEYCIKKLSNEVKLENGGYVEFEKPSIKKDFCFGYSDYYGNESYDKANELARKASEDTEYFIRKNISGMLENLKTLQNRENEIVFIKTNNDANIYAWESKKEFEKFMYGAYRDVETFECTENDRKELIRVLKEEIEKFGKRLNTYLKKYGLSKVHSWSYWVDA